MENAGTGYSLADTDRPWAHAARDGAATAGRRARRIALPDDE
jgi:hypothetical protein